METKLFTLAFVILSSAVSARAADATVDEDYKKIQGTWKCSRLDQFGQELQLRNVYKGHRVSFTMVNYAGKVLLAGTAEFRLEKTGQVAVMRVGKRVFTVQPSVGGSWPDSPESFIYRIDSDHLTLLHGFLLEELSKMPWDILLYTRMKDQDKPKKGSKPGNDVGHHVAGYTQTITTSNAPV